MLPHAARETSQRISVVVELLALSRVEAEEDPDWVLGTWLRAIPYPASVLSEALIDERLSDEDLERLWVGIGAMAEQLGPEFYRQVLPRLLGRHDIERTASAVRASKTTVTDLHDGQGARSALGQSLLEALLASPRRSDKSFLAQWVKDISAGNSLGHLNELDPSDEDLDILIGVFPNSKRLQSIIQSRR